MTSLSFSRLHALTEPGSVGVKIILVLILLCLGLFAGFHVYSLNVEEKRVYLSEAAAQKKKESLALASGTTTPAPAPTLDKALYDKKMLALANYPKIVITSTTSTTTLLAIAKSTSTRIWPVKAPYPKEGAILPFKRIIAYYGNFYSTRMGILGEFETPVMLTKLKAEVKKWEAADPDTPVVPAIHYIASVAQADAGKDGMYRFRMPDEHIQKAMRLAKEVNGIVFLDLQTGHSPVVSEVNAIKKYLMYPEVHLGLDPEFSMKPGQKPGRYVGTMDASEINQAIDILAQIVRDNNLPPKILIIHRFTFNMLTNHQNIKKVPEVQVVINMDGWGSPELKTGTHKAVITPFPVQFTGFKIFYKNDLRKPSTRLLTPGELLKLQPAPSYIQYQ